MSTTHCAKFGKSSSGLRLSRPLFCWLFSLELAGLNAAAAPVQPTADGKAIFQEKCSDCHSIGGGEVIGPDLKGVTAKRDRAWLLRWISEPEAMVDEGDPLAKELMKRYNDLPMPGTKLSTADADALLAFIESQSQGGKENDPIETSSPGGQFPPMGDVTAGLELFTGARAFQESGISCMACHSVAGVGALGGGNMGPDLTHVYKRFGDNGLARALKTLPFPTMKYLYDRRPLSEEEQGHLRAFFAEANAEATETGAGVTRRLWFIGSVGGVLLFGILAVFRRARPEALKARSIDRQDH